MSALEKLDWSLVQAFLAVAETGSLSAAARRLTLTQPTVGRHIQSLEADLGVTLFRRQARGMSLSDQGAALLEHARRMREAAEALSLNAAGRSEDLSGTVRITASVFSSHYYLPQIIVELREAHPEIDIELVPSDQSENLLFRKPTSPSGCIDRRNWTWSRFMWRISSWRCSGRAGTSIGAAGLRASTTSFSTISWGTTATTT